MRLEQERDALFAAMADAPGHVSLMSNEIGFGVVPAAALGRFFRDELGTLHQPMAQRCDAVALCVAGLPLWLKR